MVLVRQYIILIYQHSIVCTVSAIISSGYCHHMDGQLVCAALFGLTYGGYCTSAILHLRSLFTDLRPALGLYFLTCGLASLAGPIIVGAIFDLCANYPLGFYTMGCAVLASALVLSLSPLLIHHRNSGQNLKRANENIIDTTAQRL